MEDKVIQTIVMRKSFPTLDGKTKTIRTGKYCAQAAHASMAFLSNKWREGRTVGFGSISTNGYSVEQVFLPAPLSEEEELWINTAFTKICLCVDTEEELMQVYESAVKASLNVHLIKDSGLTEFDEPTYTALAIGPHYKSKIDVVTRDLRLF